MYRGGGYYPLIFGPMWSLAPTVQRYILYVWWAVISPQDIGGYLYYSNIIMISYSSVSESVSKYIATLPSNSLNSDIAGVFPDKS